MRWCLALAIVVGTTGIALASDAPPPAISVEPTKDPATPSEQGAQHATIRLDGEWQTVTRSQLEGQLSDADLRGGDAASGIAWYRRPVTIPPESVGGRRRLRLVVESVDDDVAVWWDGHRLFGHGAFPLPVETTAGRHALVVRARTPPRAASLVGSGPVTIDEVTVTARPKGRRSGDVVLAYTLTNRSSVDLIVELVTTFAGPGLRRRHAPAVGATVALHAGTNRAELRTRLRGVAPTVSYAADTRVVFEVTSDRRVDRFELRRVPDGARLR